MSAKVNENDPSSQTAQLTNHIVAIKPMVPKTRIGGKSVTVSIPLFFSMVNAVVLANAIVGMKNATLSVYIVMNIDLENSRIHICKHFIIDKSGSHIQNGCKTNAGDRWLTMDSSIMDMLREYRAYYDKTAEKYRNKWNYKDNAVKQ